MGNASNDIVIKNRESIIVTGVISVDSFDENSIMCTSCDSVSLCIEGKGLSIKDVNLEKSVLEAEGNICSVYYLEGNSSGHGLLRGLFGKK